VLRTIYRSVRKFFMAFRAVFGHGKILPNPANPFQGDCNPVWLHGEGDYAVYFTLRDELWSSHGLQDVAARIEELKPHATVTHVPRFVLHGFDARFI